MWRDFHIIIIILFLFPHQSISHLLGSWPLVFLPSFPNVSPLTSLSIYYIKPADAFSFSYNSTNFIYTITITIAIAIYLLFSSSSSSSSSQTQYFSPFLLLFRLFVLLPTFYLFNGDYLFNNTASFSLLLLANQLIKTFNSPQ